MPGQEKNYASGLSVIKEGDEVTQESVKKQNYQKFSRLTYLAQRSASISNIDKQILNKPADKIVNKCKDNPFLRSKLHYLLKSEVNRDEKSTICQPKNKSGEPDWCKTTLKKEVNALKEVQDQKLLELQKRLKKTKYVI